MISLRWVYGHVPKFVSEDCCGGHKSDSPQKPRQLAMRPAAMWDTGATVKRKLESLDDAQLAAAITNPTAVVEMTTADAVKKKFFKGLEPHEKLACGQYTYIHKKRTAATI